MRYVADVSPRAWSSRREKSTQTLPLRISAQMVEENVTPEAAAAAAAAAPAATTVTVHGDLKLPPFPARQDIQGYRIWRFKVKSLLAAQKVSSKTTAEIVVWVEEVEDALTHDFDSLATGDGKFDEIDMKLFASLVACLDKGSGESNWPRGSRTRGRSGMGGRY